MVPKYGPLKRLLRRTLEYTSLQILVQGLGFAVGLLVVRSLSKEEYFYFTVASSLVGAIASLSDLGLSAALLALAGPVIREPRRAARVLREARRFQIPLSIFAGLVGITSGLWLYNRHAIAWVVAVPLVLIACVAGIASSRVAIVSVLPRLRNDLRLIQKVELTVALGRLTALGLFLLFLPAAVLVVVVNAVGLAVQEWWLRKKSSPPKADTIRSEATDTRLHMLRLISRQAPNSILFLFSSQAALWLIVVFGGTETVADFGALGRLTAVFTIIASVASAIILPYFARTQDRSALISGFITLCFVLMLLVIGTTIVTAVAPGTLLLIIGQRYSGLEDELVLITASTLLSTVAFVLYGVNASKGWIIPFVASGGIWAISIVIGVNVFDVATVRGGASLNMFTAALSVLLSLLWFSRGILRFGHQQDLPSRGKQ